ncbi:MAG: ABC transporter permease [Bacteroidales bacterium]|nr:ABC transporter permease [Bacteroidales bacterium]
MLLLSAFFSDAFFTSSNLFNLLRQVTPVGIISMGMLLVILTGGIDLSVGSVVAMSGVLVAYFTQLMDLPSSIFLSLTAGLIVGMISGFFVAYQKMAPFIVTLALMTIVRGTGFIISKGAPIMVHEDELDLVDFGSGYFLGLPNPGIVLFLVFGIVLVILRYNVFGRIVIAIGSNEEAVRLSGIKVQRYKFAVYMIAGVLSSLAGIMLVSRSSVGSPVMAVGMELDVIAAVVIGGASLKGGKGSALNTLLGVLILGMIGNIMNLKDVPAYPQQVIKGVIILFAVLLQRYQDK